MILPLCCLLWHLATPAWAQETLSLKECREMALKYNKEMAASVKQTESARYTAKSYKGNFFPNFTVSGTGLYSNADGSYGIAGGNLPVFLPDGTGQFNPGQPAGFAYFPGINLDYKIGWVYMGGVQMEQPLYMGGKIRAAYKMSLLGKEMAQMNENLTATEVIQKTDQAYILDQSCSQCHRSQCHGDAVCILRIYLLCHYRPCRTAGGCHKWDLLRYFV